MREGSPILPASRAPDSPASSSLSLQRELREAASGAQRVSSAASLLPSLASLFPGSISYLVPCRILQRTHASARKEGHILLPSDPAGSRRWDFLGHPLLGSHPFPSPLCPQKRQLSLGHLHDSWLGARAARVYIIFHKYTSDVSCGVRRAAVRGPVKACYKRKRHLRAEWEETATRACILAWETPRAEEPGGLYSPWGCKGVGPTLATKQTKLMKTASFSPFLPRTGKSEKVQALKKIIFGCASSVLLHTDFLQ